MRQVSDIDDRVDTTCSLIPPDQQLLTARPLALSSSSAARLGNRTARLGPQQGTIFWTLALGILVELASCRCCFPARGLRCVRAWEAWSGFVAGRPKEQARTRTPGMGAPSAPLHDGHAT